jgi:hypothetical protein
VVPLAAQQRRDESGALLDGRSNIQLDPLAAKVMLKGEAVQSAKGRADDFSWPAAPAEATTDGIAPIAPAAENRQTPPAKRAARSKAESKKAERADSNSPKVNAKSASSRSR